MPVDNPRGAPAVAPNRGPVKPVGRITPPAGPPAPILHQHGISSVQELNDKVAAVVDAHVKATGVKPSPALVFDVVRSPVGRDQYADMFRFPSLGKAKAASTLTSAGINPEHPETPADQLVRALGNVRTHDQLAAFTDPENDAVVKQALADPHTRKQVLKAWSAAQRRANKPDPTRTGFTESGFPISHGVLSKIVGVGALASEQISTALVLGLPTLAIAEGKAVGESAKTGSLKPIAKTNAKLATGVVAGVKRDVTHPGENPGYLFLDVLGLASVGAGAVARGAAAGRAFSEQGAVAALKAAARKPLGGTAPLTKSGFTEDQLLTDNAALRPLQRVLVRARNTRMERRANPTPAGALHIGLGERAQAFLDVALDPLRANFSSENKLGRESRVRRRIDTQLQMSVKRDLDVVAGWSQTASKAYQRINQRLPNRLRGLTVGEQKAIEALSLDDPAPLETWRAFHEKMIDLGVGDAKAHRAQLAALKLAEEVLKNPRKRFTEALALTRQVVAEQERIKAADLGLQVETANRRVIGEGAFVRAASQATTAEEVTKLLAKPGELGGGPKLSESSQYIPRQRKGKPRRGVSERLELMSPQAGKFGVPEPGMPSSLKHEYTGKSVLAGDFRIDATALAGEEYACVVRAASKLHEWRKLRDNGLDRPTDLRWYRPVRKGQAVDEQLREIVDRALDAELTTEDALHLSDVEARDLERYLYPAEYKNGQWHLLSDVDPGDVTWVDVRQLDRYRPPAPQGLKTFFQIANEPFRDIALLYRLAYALNAVGNVGMGLIHQGPFLVPNLMRTLHAESLYGAKTARALETLAGTSRSASYAPVGVGEGIGRTLTAPGRVAAKAWNVVTDQKFRESAIVYELRRQAKDLGLDEDNLEPLLFDKKYVKQRNEAVRRGSKAMVEFDNLAWFEREYLRHFVFVYPWVSRSFVWSLRSIAEHPAQTAVLAQIGREADEELPGVLKRVPEWFKRIGYVPIGTNHDGSPRLVNPSSVNTFSTLSQLLYPFEAGVKDVPYASTGDLLGPAARFAIHGITGKDEFGNDYPGSDWWGAARDVLIQLPQLRPSQKKTNEPLPGVDLSDRETLVKRLNAGLKETVFAPGWLGGYGSLLSGGLTPRTLNPAAAEARYYRDLPLEQRHKIETQLIHKALHLQAGLLETTLPGKVKDAVDLASDIDLAYKQQAKELGRDPTDKERLQTAISVLGDHARINDADQQTLVRKLGKITDPAELDRFRAGLMTKYADAKVLHEWDADVRYVWSFRPEVLQPKLDALKAQGLVASKALPKDQETLFAWGRKALAYRQEARKRAQQIEAAQGTHDAPVLEADYVAWLDTHDKPLNVNGHRLPSPVRMEWANVAPDEQAQHVAALTKASWSGLTNFDKELLGRNVPASTSQAWAEVAQTVAAYKEQYPGKSIQRDQLDGLAKIINRDPRYQGFLKDYLYSREPRIRRFEQTSVYRTMPERDAFDRIVGNDARVAAKAMASGAYSNAEVRAAWNKYVEQEVVPKLDKHPKLNAFLQPYGVTFLTGLVSR